MARHLPFPRGYSFHERSAKKRRSAVATIGRRVNRAAMPAASFDRRLTPARADLAAEHLRGLVDAPRYAEGRGMRIIAASAPLRRAPRADAPLETEALFGESVTVYDESDGLGLGAARARPVCRLSASRRARSAVRADPSGRGAAHARLSRPRDQAAAAHGALAWRAADDRGPRGRLRGLGGRALPLVARLDGTQRARTGLRRGRRALSRDALSLGRPDVRRHRLLGPGSDGAHGGRRRVAARQRHDGGGPRRAYRHRRSRARRSRAAISCSGRATSGSCAIPSRCFTPTAGT